MKYTSKYIDYSNSSCWSIKLQKNLNILDVTELITRRKEAIYQINRRGTSIYSNEIELFNFKHCIAISLHVNGERNSEEGLRERGRDKEGIGERGKEERWREREGETPHHILSILFARCIWVNGKLQTT